MALGPDAARRPERGRLVGFTRRRPHPARAQLVRADKADGSRLVSMTGRECPCALRERSMSATRSCCAAEQDPLSKRRPSRLASVALGKVYEAPDRGQQRTRDLRRRSDREATPGHGKRAIYADGQPVGFVLTFSMSHPQGHFLVDDRRGAPAPASASPATATTGARARREPLNACGEDQRGAVEHRRAVPPPHESQQQHGRDDATRFGARSRPAWSSTSTCRANRWMTPREHMRILNEVQQAPTPYRSRSAGHTTADGYGGASTSLKTLLFSTSSRIARASASISCLLA